ncbi:MAG: hypothetical protein M0R51_05315 [Clostridia bacterium]|nr:hypothetical protein [Clostridia bacterium]
MNNCRICKHSDKCTDIPESWIDAYYGECKKFEPDTVALHSAVSDVNLWHTEDNEFTALIRSAVDKLWKMKKEVK